MWIRDLDPEECTKMLGSGWLGRLACCMEGQPYVVPIHYAYAERRLYAFSMPGRKIEAMRANSLVSMLVEERGAGRGWRSVIAEGRYEELPDRIGHKRQRDRAWSLLSRHASWWEPGALKPGTQPIDDPMRHIFFSIVVDRMSGREAAEEA